jgi:hypothetical protein
LMKKVGPESSTASTLRIQSIWPVHPKYMMKNVCPETSPTAHTWLVQPI